jgi:predicted lipid-binding transport protein (Tim44 family)
MNGSFIELLALAGIAVFLILKLRSVLGTREGFEKPPIVQDRSPEQRGETKFEVIDGGVDLDIADHAADGSDTAVALAAMKKAEPSFNVSEFLGGARGAYEMILMAFESGDLDDVVPFLSPDVYESFATVVTDRADKGLIVEATFIGIRELTLHDATFDPATGFGEVSVKFVGELTGVVRDSAGDIIEGDPKEVKRQKDIWTFGRTMGANDPNWQLVATGG